MKFFKKLSIYLMIAGVAAQFINIITYGYWEIDIDIFGAMVFIVGLIMFLVIFFVNVFSKEKGKINRKK